MIAAMGTPLTFLVLLVAGLLALLPAWRLRATGWSASMLASTWLILAVLTFVAIRVPGPGRILLPILVLAYLIPFVAGPERLVRVLRRRAGAPPTDDAPPTG